MNKQPEALRLAAVAICNRDLEWHSSVTAELRSLYDALQDWNEKTYWVQKTAAPKELGLHRADVLRARIDDAEAQRDGLLEALKIIMRQNDHDMLATGEGLRLPAAIRARGEE